MKKLLIIFAIPSLLVFSCSKGPKNTVQPVVTQMVATYAGNGTQGLQNGAAGSAEFSFPADIALDPMGNVFVADAANNVIRRITASGVVSTYAGNGTAGYKDASAASAEFNGPAGIVIDDVGNLYVSDSQNNVIRQITPAGDVSTYAGNGTQGLQNGSPLSAEFARPYGLTIDKSRNIYVADNLNNVIRKITSGGAVSTYAGNGTPGLQNGSALSAEFNRPSGVTIDPSNNLYVAETPNKTVRQITLAGMVSTYASNFTSPQRVTADPFGNLYVTDSNTIQKITAAGSVSLFAGMATPGFIDGTLLNAQFNTPIGILSDVQGNLLIADYGNNRIRVILRN